jgi:hypothetical protein
MTPVHVVAAGRRNNPPEEGIRALCPYNPLHYMELPELFIEFISSMTGKSPSTTGAGSEGALTKGPFNMPAGDHRPQCRLRLLRAHRATTAGFLGPATSGRTCASITTSACWCPRSSRA